MSEDYVLELEHIRKEYSGVIALKNVTLQLRCGEILGLIGENGAGKSTMFWGRPIRKDIVIYRKAMEEEAAKAFEQLHIKINPKELVKNLSLGYQQKVEITKAIQQNAQVLIMDEPSAPLTTNEAERPR